MGAGGQASEKNIFNPDRKPFRIVLILKRYQIVISCCVESRYKTTNIGAYFDEKSLQICNGEKFVVQKFVPILSL